MRIPILDLKPDIESHWQEYVSAFEEVLKSGQFIGGPNVVAFEREIASYLGVKHAIACNSGTDALVIGLRALGVQPGDEVIVPGFTFFATSESVNLVGASPVFVDIDPRSYNLDVAKVEAALTSRTRAIIPVHLYGNAANMEPLLALAQDRGIKVLEDTAQAMGGEYRGKKLGALGDLGAFSFFPSKNLGAFGDGGLMTTDSDETAHTCRLLRNHGAIKRYCNEQIGYNSRLDELQAAFLRIKLRTLDEANEGRMRVAGRYKEMFDGAASIVTPVACADSRHVFHQYTIRITNGTRDKVAAGLEQAGIASMIYYPIPLHRLSIYADSGHSLPEAERASTQVISLPIWPQLPVETQSEISSAVRALVEAG